MCCLNLIDIFFYVLEILFMLMKIILGLESMVGNMFNLDLIVLYLEEEGFVYCELVKMLWFWEICLLLNDRE